MANRLVVKVTCGTDDPERANQAFTVAAAAVTCSGVSGSAAASKYGRGFAPVTFAVRFCGNCRM